MEENLEDPLLWENEEERATFSLPVFVPDTVETLDLMLVPTTRRFKPEGMSVIWEGSELPVDSILEELADCVLNEDEDEENELDVLS